MRNQIKHEKLTPKAGSHMGRKACRHHIAELLIS